MSHAHMVEALPPGFHHAIAQHLSSDGVGGGVKNANGVYTLGTDDGVFSIYPPVGSTYYLARMLLSIQDDKVAAPKYGNLDALTNGILLQAGHGTTVDWNVINSDTISSNAMWGHHMYDIHYQIFGTGGADELLNGRLTFTRMGGFLRLDGDKREFLRIVCQDDLSGLVGHEFVCQGVDVTRATRTNS